VNSCNNCVIRNEQSKYHITSYIILAANSKQRVLLQAMIKAMIVQSTITNIQDYFHVSTVVYVHCCSGKYWSKKNHNYSLQSFLSVQILVQTQVFNSLNKFHSWFKLLTTKIKLYHIQIFEGPGSSVGIATDYGLDGPGIESRWGEIFLTRPNMPRGPTSILHNRYRVFPGGKVARAWCWPPTPS
jgi:hypothetical protein